MKQSPLSRVEGLIRRVVETPFTWLDDDSLDPFRLASYLVQHHQEPLRDGDGPLQFVIAVSPNDYEQLAEQLPTLEAQVAGYVALLSERHGLGAAEPRIRFEPDNDESPHRARVLVGRADAPPESNTEVLAVEMTDAVMDAIRAADAFLIVQGRRHVPLDRPVTRIGRRMDNDIVLDMPAISRQHAQVRWRQRYFVLYDVSSHGRTAVNGMTTREHVLRPGDVIALSDAMLVYGEGRDDLLAVMPESDGEELDTTQLKPAE